MYSIELSKKFRIKGKSITLQKLVWVIRLGGNVHADDVEASSDIAFPCTTRTAKKIKQARFVSK